MEIDRCFFFFKFVCYSALSYLTERLTGPAVDPSLTLRSKNCEKANITI